MTVMLIVTALLYFVAGSGYARREAGREYERRANLGAPDLSALDSNTHTRNCDLRYYGNKPCDCDQQSAYNKARRDERAWDALAEKPIVGANYFHVLLWPFYIHRAFLLAEAGRESRTDRRRRHEIENARHIAQVTSILQRNQQSISSLDIVDQAAADVEEAGR